MTGHNVLHTMGYDAFGLPAEQYAVQTGQHPRITTEANIATMRRAAAPARAGARPAPQRRHHRRRRTTAGRSGSSCRSSTPGTTPRRGRARPIAELVGGLRRPASGPTARTAVAWRDLDDLAAAAHRRRAPAGVPDRGAGQLVPRPGHGAGQRGGHRRRAQRPRQLPGLQARTCGSGCCASPRTPTGCSPTSTRSTGRSRSSCMQRNWIGRSDGARVAFPSRGRARSRSSPRGPTRCSARPSWCWRPSTRWSTRSPPTPGPTGTPAVLDGRRSHARATPSPAYRRAGRAQDRPRAPGRGPGEDRRVHRRATRPTRSTAQQIPVFVADYVLMGYGTGAIMAVPGQDERDWEFAEEFDLPIVRTVAAAGGLERARRSSATGPAINSANDEISLDGLDVGGGQEPHHRLAGGSRARRAARSPTSCATGCSAGSATGASRSRSSTTRPACPIALPDVDAAGRAARGRRLLAADVRRRRRSLASPSRRWPGRPTGSTSRSTWATGPRSTAARRTRCRSGPARAGTSCATSTRPTRSAFVDPEVERYWMGPRPRVTTDRRRRPVRRRRRARRAAPAVRAVLAQGAVRPRPRARAASRSTGCSTRATSRPPPTPTTAASTSPPTRCRGGRGRPSDVLPRRASRSPASSARWARA